jgi:hypothetical protein
VPISQAVQASSALPGLFPPVEIDDKYYVDGALKKTMHASVAMDHGGRPDAVPEPAGALRCHCALAASGDAARPAARQARAFRASWTAACLRC